MILTHSGGGMWNGAVRYFRTPYAYTIYHAIISHLAGIKLSDLKSSFYILMAVGWSILLLLHSRLMFHESASECCGDVELRTQIYAF